MPPATEPSPADVAAVDAALNNQPAPAAEPPAPAPAPTTPEAAPQPPPAPTTPPVTPQPAPTSQPAAPPVDPFAAFMQPETPPAPPTQSPPAPPETPPTPPADQTPAQPPAPAAAEPPASSEPQYQSFEDYMKTVTDGVGQPPEQPDPANINPENPAEIKQFFDDLVNTAVQRAEQSLSRKQAIQNSERHLWDEAFNKYGSLRQNKPLRDMVHSIRMGYFQRSIAITPTQAADKLLESLGTSYKKGVADNQVHTTIEDVQPQGGGTGQPLTTTGDVNQDLLSVQTGGETALADILDREIKAGNL